MANSNFLFFQSFALGHIFGELEPFFQYSTMADTNFLFPMTLGKPFTQNLGEWGIGSFALGIVFGELEQIFQFFIIVDANFLFLMTVRKP